MSESDFLEHVHENEPSYLYQFRYILTQIPGSALALCIGGKHVYGIAMAISIVCTLLVPVGARLSPYVLIALRVLQGLAMVSSL